MYKLYSIIEIVKLEFRVYNDLLKNFVFKYNKLRNVIQSSSG